MTNANWLKLVTIGQKIQFEDSGDDVKWLQKVLISRGYLPKGSDDGILGNATRDAWGEFSSAQREIEQGIQEGDLDPVYDACEHGSIRILQPAESSMSDFEDFLPDDE